MSALTDPVRRRLYDFVASHDDPVRRDDAAAAASISRTLAAYHLDRLVTAGLLVTTYARRPGRAGPGAGRPAKLYHRAPEEVSVSVPPRSYDVLASLLADAVARDDGATARADLLAAAEQEGARAAAEGADLLENLAARGYEPALCATGDIDLRNCPFHQLAQRHVDLVCGLNTAMLRGLLTARGEDADRAQLRPRPGRCCVVIRSTSPRGAPACDVEPSS
ncbi:MAG: helix-turn-helix transcriptional regulator [Terrabacter sp.]